MDAESLRRAIAETAGALEFEAMRARDALASARSAVVEAERVVALRERALEEVTVRLEAQRVALALVATALPFVPTYNDAAPVDSAAAPAREGETVYLAWRDGRSDERLTLLSESHDGVTVSVQDARGIVFGGHREMFTSTAPRPRPDLSGLAAREAG